MILRPNPIAESRGPGVRHHFEDSGDDYELYSDPRARGIGGRSGRIILLGDGTEVLTDSDDTEMFDHDEEDKDLESQANHGRSVLREDREGVRSEREETPGPQPQQSNERPHTPEHVVIVNPFDTPPSARSEKSDSIDTAAADSKSIPASLLPDKLIAPAKDT